MLIVVAPEEEENGEREKNQVFKAEMKYREESRQGITTSLSNQRPVL
jgi:hypothetical protein